MLRHVPLQDSSCIDFQNDKYVDHAECGGYDDVIFDVLNLLNDTAEEAMATDNLFSSTTFGKPTVFVDPRRAMISVRLNLGR